MEAARTGRVYFQKSPANTGSRRRSLSHRTCITRLRRAARALQASSTPRAMAVAKAAPRTPRAGKPSRPKMSRALRMMFSTTAEELIRELTAAAPVFFSTVR